ncbi:hypothetical protein D3C77_313130 [compost metagenome]
MMLISQQLAQHVLGAVRILIFIDVNIGEFLLIEVEHFGNFLEQLDRLHDQIVEIQGVVMAKPLLIHHVHFGDDSFEIVSHFLLIFLRSDQFVLRGADHGLNRLRLKFLRIDIEILHAIANDG